MNIEPPIGYIDRTRAYYQALGYGAPYRWARAADVPLTPLKKPLNRCRVAIVTTAAPFLPGKGDQGPGAVYNPAAKFYRVYVAETDPMPDLRISHVAIDRDHTTAEDMASYFPQAALQQVENEKEIGVAAGQFFGLPTNRSQDTTLTQDAPDLLHHCQKAKIDAVVLVANCPVCHQSVTLAAQFLEAAGLSTVIMGCARDVVEHVGAPRFVFSDFPLGNAAGRPNDPASQAETLGLALDLLASAKGPRSTLVSAQVWHGSPDWKQDYANASRLTAAEIARRKAAFDAGKATAQRLREGRTP